MSLWVASCTCKMPDFRECILLSKINFYSLLKILVFHQGITILRTLVYYYCTGYIIRTRFMVFNDVMNKYT